ncbi:MAG: hypothetical protein OWQ54_00395 [Sulfolobaceae archaeon]|nr:hypothetical protein [Sulfolobaceae archaeon]
MSGSIIVVNIILIIIIYSLYLEMDHLRYFTLPMGEESIVAGVTSVTI